MPTNTDVVKLKRGRKSKLVNQINNDPIFEDEIPSDTIVKLNKIDNDKLDINHDILKDQFSEIKDNYILKKSQICWNCCKKLDNVNISLPINYDNGIYNTIGDFCSYNCALRYSFDNFSEKVINPHV